MMRSTYTYREKDWYIVPKRNMNIKSILNLNSVLVHSISGPHHHRNYYWDYYDLKSECPRCGEMPPEDITTLWVLENMDTKDFSEFK